MAAPVTTMPHQRNDRVHLPPDEPRCVPENKADICERCARYLAPLPATGASMIGAGLPPMFYGGAYCFSYIPLLVSHAPTAQPRPIKPAVKGLS
jgi:hypothetical protein